MAKSNSVWGIDIGQCALKALRCRRDEQEDRIVAEAFDYIEYPKILSQPEVNPVELIRDALTQFLSRNSVKGDKVAISVSGQNGLARFIKLPPVESSKIPDIVKYEAKQQIPFPLEDVIWDFQQMVGGSVEDGFALETEVGLFAMKRDQVYRALKPFDDAEIEVDYIQLTPLALYNYIAFDQMQDLPPPEEYDPDNPPESVVVLSLGTETTDLVITNGFRVWQRSLAIGGNHFTKALTKELKLTFASAEHLKRNAAQAEDPKAIFQAMRPVFSDLLTEIQRSISFFTNLDRRARIGRAVALGNAMKLPGLQRYLAQNLGFDLTRVENFRGLTGGGVVDAPQFKENLPAFGVCYGLCLQGLRPTRIRTNLLPKEIAQERLIRSKQPWAVGAAAALLLAMSVNYFFHYRAYGSVAPSVFEQALGDADRVLTEAKRTKNAVDAAQKEYQKTEAIASELMRNIEGRIMWPSVMKAITLALPQDEGEQPAEIDLRNQVHIVSIETQRFDNLQDWWSNVKGFADLQAVPPPPTPKQNAAAQAADAQPEEEVGEDGEPIAVQPDLKAGPTGPGWMIRLRGHHYHNRKEDILNRGAEFVRNTLLANLQKEALPLPESERIENGPTEWPVGRLGVGYPVLVSPGNIQEDYQIDVVSNDGTISKERVPRFDFVVELCWQERPVPELTEVVVLGESVEDDAPAPSPPAAGDGANAAAAPAGGNE